MRPVSASQIAALWPNVIGNACTRMGAPRHRRILVLLGEAVKLAADLAQIAQEQRMCARLSCSMVPVSSTSCVVGPKWTIFAVIAVADSLQGAQRRHQRMFGAADFCGDDFEIDVCHLGLARDLVGSGLRHDAELGLRQRESGFVDRTRSEPGLVVEDRAQLVGAPDVLEQGGIEHA